MLDGTYEFVLGEEMFQVSAEAFFHVPRGTPLGFRNATDTVARMLIINFPGGLHENFFSEAGDLVNDAAALPPVSPPDVPRLVEAAARYGIPR